MAVVPSGGQDFEKPDAGIYLARIFDVFNRGLVQSKNPANPPVVRVRLYWVLFDPNRPDYKQKNGMPFTHMKDMPWKMTPPTKYKASAMYDVARGVFNGAANIPAPFDDDLFIGRANQIVLTIGQDPQYREITSILPVPKGMEQLVPVIPAGYIRLQNRPKQGTLASTQAAGQAVVATAAPAAQQEVADEDIPF
jgi:hypothetical protein